MTMNTIAPNAPELSRDARRLLYAISAYSNPEGDLSKQIWMKVDTIYVLGLLGIKAQVFSEYDMAPALFPFRGVKMFAMLSQEAIEDANKAMNLLTAASIIFLPLTLITGIYGMNFLQYADTDSKSRVSSTNMPELYWEYGYLFSFGLMALAVVATSVLLWRMGVIGRKTKGRKSKKKD
jgi:hypothetical protein